MKTIMFTSIDHDNNNVVNNDVISPPPWEVLVLVANHLDPKSLATASCVSTTWSSCFSSDHLWAPLCLTHFPFLSSLTTTVSTTVPHRRLYALGHAARLRRLKTRPKPRLALDQLLFTLTLTLPNTAKAFHVIKPCTAMQHDPHGLFRFDIEVDAKTEWAVEELNDVKVTWNAVERDWKGVFTMAEECGGRGSFTSGVEGWFSQELPSPGCCCSSTMSSGLVADLRLGLVPLGGHEENNNNNNNNHQDHEYCWGAWGCRNKKVRIEKVSVGILSILNWRYVSLEDGLFYLEHFLRV